MFQPFKSLLVASILLGFALTSTVAAEREDVRKAINLVSSVKMPFPESLSRNRAKTEHVWLEREGATTGCITLGDRRWCYDHIAPKGNRAEMLRIRNEPSRGVSIGAPYYYIVDYDLDGLIDVGRRHRSRRRTVGVRHRLRMSPSFSRAAPSVGNSSKESSKACTTRASRSR